MWKRKGKGEWLPWYRVRGYKGNLTEDDKRVLDSIRLRNPHPAATYDSLPEEAQRYITRLEGEVHENKQQVLGLGVLFISGIGGYHLVRYLLGYDEGTPLLYVWSTFMLIAPWTGKIPQERRRVYARRRANLPD